MILVDTSVRIGHLRDGDSELARLLEEALVLGHPWVLGELSLGHLRNRREVLGLLSGLPQAVVATDAEVLTLIEGAPLHGLGIGWVDAHLLTAVWLTPDAHLWTRATAAGLRSGMHSAPR